MLDLKASKKGDERGQTFWNTSASEMKFSGRKAKRKANYGMLNMDNQLEEIVGNKLELVVLWLIHIYLKLANVYSLS